MGVIARRDEAPAQPERCGIRIHCMHHQGPSTHQMGGSHAALQGMLDQPRTDALTRPERIRRELPQQQTGNRIRRLAGAYGAWQLCGQHHRGCQAVEPNHSGIHTHHDDRRKSFLLVRQRARLQPAVQRCVAAGEGRYVVPLRKRLWPLDPGSPCAHAARSQGAGR